MSQSGNIVLHEPLVDDFSQGCKRILRCWSSFTFLRCVIELLWEFRWLPGMWWQNWHQQTLVCTANRQVVDKARMCWWCWLGGCGKQILYDCCRGLSSRRCRRRGVRRVDEAPPSRLRNTEYFKLYKPSGRFSGAVYRFSEIVRIRRARLIPSRRVHKRTHAFHRESSSVTIQHHYYQSAESYYSEHWQQSGYP